MFFTPKLTRFCKYTPLLKNPILKYPISKMISSLGPIRLCHMLTTSTQYHVSLMLFLSKKFTGSLKGLVRKNKRGYKPERQWQCSILVTWFPSLSRDNDSALPLAEVLLTYYGLYVIVLSIISIKNAKLTKYNRSKPEILRLLWDIVVFRLVAYLLSMTCSILHLLYKIASIWIFV